MTLTRCIGVGNLNGRAAAAAEFCQQLALHLVSIGQRVAIADTSQSVDIAIWCADRAIRMKTLMNGGRSRIDYLYFDTLPAGRRLKHYGLGVDTTLLAYDSDALELGTAMDHVDHWIVPTGPEDVERTVAVRDQWLWVHRPIWGDRSTCTAVLMVPPAEPAAAASMPAAPSSADRSDVPDRDAHLIGDLLAGELLRRAPGLEIAHGRLGIGSSGQEAGLAELWPELVERMARGPLTGWPQLARSMPLTATPHLTYVRTTHPGAAAVRRVSS